MNSDTLLTVVGCSELAPSVPNGRDLAISCGAAIEFGYLAIRALGSDCHVALLPDPNDPDLLATLAVGPSGVPDDDAKALTEAMPRRYTDRGAVGADWSRQLQVLGKRPHQLPHLGRRASGRVASRP
jgi:hypothetical protein